MESYPAFVIVRIRVHPYHVDGKTLLEINAGDQCRRNSKMRKSPFSNHEWNNWFRKSEWSMTIKTIMSKLDNAKVLPQSFLAIFKGEIYNRDFLVSINWTNSVSLKLGQPDIMYFLHVYVIWSTQHYL